MAKSVRALCVDLHFSGKYVAKEKSKKGKPKSNKPRRTSEAKSSIRVVAIQMTHWRSGIRDPVRHLGRDSLVVINVHLNFMVAKKEDVPRPAYQLKIF